VSVAPFSIVTAVTAMRHHRGDLPSPILKDHLIFIMAADAREDP
jgi:hypothetical protein